MKKVIKIAALSLMVASCSTARPTLAENKAKAIAAAKAQYCGTGRANIKVNGYTVVFKP